MALGDKLSLMTCGHSFNKYSAPLAGYSRLHSEAGSLITHVLGAALTWEPEQREG